MNRSPRYVRTFALLVLVLGSMSVAGRPAVTAAAPPVMQEPHRPPVEVTVTARKYSFTPSRIEVEEGDIVKITLKAEDIPHTFTIDKPYRISKRATPGQPATFEFRADQAGTFIYYCELTSDPKCRDMKGELVVHARR